MCGEVRRGCHPDRHPPQGCRSVMGVPRPGQHRSPTRPRRPSDARPPSSSSQAMSRPRSRRAEAARGAATYSVSMLRLAAVWMPRDIVTQARLSVPLRRPGRDPELGAAYRNRTDDLFITRVVCTVTGLGGHPETRHKRSEGIRRCPATYAAIVTQIDTHSMDRCRLGLPQSTPGADGPFRAGRGLP
jgi:hypothetical protein